MSNLHTRRWRYFTAHTWNRDLFAIYGQIGKCYSAEIQWKQQTRAQSTSQIGCRFFYLLREPQQSENNSVKTFDLFKLHLHGYYASMNSINTTKCWMWIVNIMTFLTDTSSSGDLRQPSRKQNKNGTRNDEERLVKFLSKVCGSYRRYSFVCENTC